MTCAKHLQLRKKFSGVRRASKDNQKIRQDNVAPHQTFSHKTATNLPDVFSTRLSSYLVWKHVEQIDSTNTYLLNHTQSVNQLISADQQTQGRGRRAQKWVDEGQSALFSLSTGFSRGTDISAWPVQVALTLATTLNHLMAHFSDTDIEPLVKVKWPNDLYIDDQNNWGKFAGILVESSIGQSGKVVTGVGMNLSPIHSDVKSDYSVGYIDLPLDKKDLIVLLANQLFSDWNTFVDTSSVSTTAYKAVDFLYGKSLIALDLHTKAQQFGIGAGINEQGHLLLDQNGKTITLTAQQRIRFAND